MGSVQVFGFIWSSGFEQDTKYVFWSVISTKSSIPNFAIKLIFHMYPDISGLHYTGQEKPITWTCLNIWQE